MTSEYAINLLDSQLHQLSVNKLIFTQQEGAEMFIFQCFIWMIYGGAGSNGHSDYMDARWSRG